LIGALSDSIPEPRCSMLRIVSVARPRAMSARAEEQNGVVVAATIRRSSNKTSDLLGRRWPRRSSDGAMSMTAAPADAWSVLRSKLRKRRGS
jgi:hypothetical protein